MTLLKYLGLPDRIYDGVPLISVTKARISIVEPNERCKEDISIWLSETVFQMIFR